MVGIRQRSPGGGRKTHVSAIIIATMIHIILLYLFYYSHKRHVCTSGYRCHEIGLSVTATINVMSYGLTVTIATVNPHPHPPTHTHLDSVNTESNTVGAIDTLCYMALHEVTRNGRLVYTERAQTAAVSRGTSHVTTQQRCEYTTSVNIQNALYKS